METAKVDGEEKHLHNINRSQGHWRRKVFHYQNLQSRNAFINVNTEVSDMVGTTGRKGKARLDFTRKHLQILSCSWTRFFWADETKINLYQNDGKGKCGEVKEQLMIQIIPYHVSNLVEVVFWYEHVWTCLLSQFSSNWWCDRSNKINWELYSAIVSVYNHTNATKMLGSRLTVKKDNDSEHTEKTTQDFLKAKKGNIILSDLNSMKHASQLLTTKLKIEKVTNKQLLKMLQRRAGKAPPRRKFMMSMDSRLLVAIDCKGFSSKYNGCI